MHHCRIFIAVRTNDTSKCAVWYKMQLCRISQTRPLFQVELETASTDSEAAAANELEEDGEESDDEDDEDSDKEEDEDNGNSAAEKISQILRPNTENAIHVRPVFSSFCPQWVENNLTNILFCLLTSVFLSPHGTTLMAFADVDGC
jgi:hypothetical protein